MAPNSAMTAPKMNIRVGVVDGEEDRKRAAAARKYTMYIFLRPMRSNRDPILTQPTPTGWAFPASDQPSGGAMPIIQVTLVRGREQATIENFIRQIAQLTSVALEAPLHSVRVMVTEVEPNHFAVGDTLKSDKA
jgi:4-oxalocrotonate tautomerase